MYRQQDVLHDILGLIDRLPGARKSATRRSPQDRRNGLQEAMIGSIVPRERRAHQAGPFLVTIAHPRSLGIFRSIFQIVTRRSRDHKIVNTTSIATADAFRTGAQPPTGLITSIGTAGTGRGPAKRVSL